MKKFWFNPEVGRWMVGDRELHCGDCFQLASDRGSNWFDVRIEMSGQEWYLIGMSNRQPSYWAGNQARLYK